jgi:hypothetical protein
MSGDQRDNQSSSEFVIYRSEDGQLRLHVRFDGQTVWLTQAAMAELFQTTPQNITTHISAIYQEGELEEGPTCKDYLQVRQEGARQVQRNLRHYNLAVILAVGYRVRSVRGTQFRQWATARLEEYVVKGFTMDDQRLKNPPGPGVPDYFDELLARIRDIRSSEKVFWRKVLDIYATSSDYNPRVEESQRFFATVQNKMHFAAHGHTAAEVIHDRADGAQPREQAGQAFAPARPGGPLAVHAPPGLHLALPEQHHQQRKHRGHGPDPRGLVALWCMNSVRHSSFRASRSLDRRNRTHPVHALAGELDELSRTTRVVSSTFFQVDGS